MSSDRGPAGSGPGRPDSPYRGLIPFDESDAAFFFGRDEWRSIVIDNLRAYRLTLCYGESGVGKTSLLRAGVAHEVHAGAEARVALGEAPEVALVVFADWRDAPLARLVESLEEAATDACGRPPDEPFARDDLQSALESCAAHVGGRVLVILDQLEEYFLYHADEQGPGTFADAFPRAVLRRDLRAHFLVSIREDALAKLDRFKASIPGLFDNCLRVELLGPDEGRDAIEGPLAKYNGLSGEIPWAIEPELVDAILDEVAAGKVHVGQSGAGVVRGSVTQSRVEAPYLQLVLMRLWTEERAAGSHVLRAQTLVRLGGAQGIVKTHLAAAMSELDEEEQDAAASMFRHLVTRSRTKIAHRVSDLADFTELPASRLQPVVEKLSSGTARILRPVGDDRFEIYHDVLADAVLAWRTSHESERELERERRRSAARDRKLRAALVGVVVLLVAIMATLALLVRRDAANREVVSQALARDALELRSHNPELALLLGVEALKIDRNDESEQSLRRVVGDSPLQRIVHNKVGLRQVALSPAGDVVASSDEANTVRMWSVRGSLGSPYVLAYHELAADGVFSRDGRLLVTTGDDGAVRIVDVRRRRVVRTLTAGRGRTRRLYDSSGQSHRSVLYLPGLTTARFDASGRQVVAARDDGDVLIWDAAGGKPVRAIHTGLGDLGSVQVAGGRVLTRARGERSQWAVWNAATGKRIDVDLGRSFADEPIAVALSPDGRQLTVTHRFVTHRGVEVLTADRRSRVVLVKRDATSAAFSPDGSRIALRVPGRVLMVASRSGRLLRGFPAPRQRSMSFASDGRLLTALGVDGVTRVWDAVRGVAVGRLPRQPDARSAAVDRRGTAAITVSAKSVFQWNLGFTPDDVDLAGHRGRVTSAAFSSDGRLVLTGGNDSSTRVWRARDGQLVSTLRASAPVRHAVFDPRGRRVATAARGGTVALWEAATGYQLAALRSRDELRSVAFSRDGNAVATAGRRGLVRIWFPARGRVVVRKAHSDLRSVAFTAGGASVVVGAGDGTVQIIDIAGRRRTVTLKPGRLRAVPDLSSVPGVGAEVSRDGRFVLGTAEDGQARLWDVQTHRLVFVEHAGPGSVVNSAHFSPDGRWLAITNDDGLVHLRRGSAWRDAGKLENIGEEIATAVFSADDRLIASGSTNGSATLWDTARRKRIADLPGLSSTIYAIDMSPGGERVVAAGENGQARVYHPCRTCPSVGALVAKARSMVGRELTAAERRKYLHGG